jgi:hypothetical protein
MKTNNIRLNLMAVARRRGSILNFARFSGSPIEQCLSEMTPAGIAEPKVTSIFQTFLTYLFLLTVIDFHLWDTSVGH